MDNGFKIVPDKYFRGNGRWTKVTRLHDKVGEPANFVQRWRAKYSVAFGIDGELKARDVRVYRLKTNAIAFAKMYIEDGTKVD